MHEAVCAWQSRALGVSLNKRLACRALVEAGLHLPLHERAQLLLHICKGLRSLHDRDLVHAEYALLTADQGATPAACAECSPAITHASCHCDALLRHSQHIQVLNNDGAGAA